MRVKARMRSWLIALKELPKKRSYIFRIDIHAALQYQMRMKIPNQESFPPLEKGVRGI